MGRSWISVSIRGSEADRGASVFLSVQGVAPWAEVDPPRAEKIRVPSGGFVVMIPAHDRFSPLSLLYDRLCPTDEPLPWQGFPQYESCNAGVDGAGPGRRRRRV